MSDDQFATVTIEGTIPIIAGLAHMIAENAIPDVCATIERVPKTKHWRLTVSVSPNYTFEEDELAEWFTNVQATGDINSFEPIDDHNADEEDFG